jgi:lipopolysaccharide transport system permease protein
MFRHEGKFWRLMSVIFKREFTVRYRRTILGVLWAVGPTALGSAAIVFATQGTNTTGSNSQNFIGVFLKFATLQITTEAISNAFQLSIRFRNLFQFSNINPLFVPISAFYFTMLNLFVRLILLAGFMVYFSIVPHWMVWVLPGVWFAAFLVGLGIALLLIPLSFVFWDIRYSAGYISWAFILLSPIFYDVEKAPQFLRILIQMNPASGLIEFSEQLMLYSTFSPHLLAYPTTVAVVSFVIGSVYYRRNILVAASYL